MGAGCQVTPAILSCAFGRERPAEVLLTGAEDVDAEGAGGLDVRQGGHALRRRAPALRASGALRPNSHALRVGFGGHVAATSFAKEVLLRRDEHRAQLHEPSDALLFPEEGADAADRLAQQLLEGGVVVVEPSAVRGKRDGEADSPGEVGQQLTAFEAEPCGDIFGDHVPPGGVPEWASSAGV
jgi:hypothetical protein